MAHPILHEAQVRPRVQEEGGGVILPLAQGGLQGGDLVPAQGVDPRERALDAADGQPLLRELRIVPCNRPTSDARNPCR
jgi:hypothetical protein